VIIAHLARLEVDDQRLSSGLNLLRIIPKVGQIDIPGRRIRGRERESMLVKCRVAG
jgi:hypothetical protein